MIPIKNFMKGFLLASVGCLLLDAIGEIITYVTELVKAKISVKIGEYNLDLAKVSKELDESPMAVIGFEAPISGEEYDDEEY